jgi:hypothetical protein
MTAAAPTTGGPQRRQGVVNRMPLLGMKKIALLAACLAAAPAVYAESKCRTDPEALRFEREARLLFERAQAGSAEQLRAMLERPGDYVQVIAEPLSYAAAFEQPVLSVTHRFSARRLCTYGGDKAMGGHEIMTDAIFRDHARIRRVNGMGVLVDEGVFEVFYHIHYTPEGRLQMAAPYITRVL